MKHAPLLTVLVLWILVPQNISADPSVFPVSTTIYHPDKCWNGFTILSSEEGRLIDMNGNLVHLWKGPLHHPNKVYPGGYLLASTAAWKHGRQDAIQIQVRDFNDNVLWKFDRWFRGKANEGEGQIWVSRQHHDMQIKGNPVGYFVPSQNKLDLSKGILLVLAHYNVQNDKINKSIQLVDDAVYEIDMARRCND